jgi:hypothetical protein
LAEVTPKVSTGSTLDARIILPAIKDITSKFAVAFLALAYKVVKAADTFVIPRGI